MPTFTVHSVPIAQPRQRHALIAGHVRNYTPARDPVNAWKAAVQMAWDEATGGSEVPIVGPVSLHVEFVLPRPMYMRKKKYAHEVIWHAKKPDLDNLLKSLKDCLNSLAWHDDSQVCRIYAVKEYAEIDGSPRAVVTIESLEDGGNDERLT